MHAVALTGDGILLGRSAYLPPDRAEQLASISSGISALTGAASRFTGGRAARMTLLLMDEGVLVVTAIDRWGLLALLTEQDAPMAEVGHEVALLVDRAAGVLAASLPAEAGAATGFGDPAAGPAPSSRPSPACSAAGAGG